MDIHIFDPLPSPKLAPPLKTKKSLGSYKHLTAFAICLLVMVWGECGYPEPRYKDGVLFVCMYDAPAHEIITRLIKGDYSHAN